VLGRGTALRTGGHFCHDFLRPQLSFRIAVLARLAGVCLLGAVPGCWEGASSIVAKREEARPATLAVHLAVGELREGLKPIKAKEGLTLYVSAQPELTRAHLAFAQALHSERRSMLRLVFGPVGTERLYQLTAGNRGSYLAIFINEELAAAPRIERPVETGEIYLVGVFGPDKCEELARALSR
jgi:preprotein translocase subunit SecD